jgi:hypothetical protein
MASFDPIFGVREKELRVFVTEDNLANTFLWQSARG